VGRSFRLYEPHRLVLCKSRLPTVFTNHANWTSLGNLGGYFQKKLSVSRGSRRDDPVPISHPLPGKLLELLLRFRHVRGTGEILDHLLVDLGGFGRLVLLLVQLGQMHQAVAPRNHDGVGIN
jgi:hypothetical protein